MRNVYRGDCRRYTFVYLSFFFVKAAGFEPTKTPAFAALCAQRKRGDKAGFYSGAFMLSTMLICLTWRRMIRQTAKVKAMVSATLMR